MTKLLIATAILAGLMAAPASAETDAEKLRNIGEVAVFVLACPNHWDRLPPRTQRIIQSITEKDSRSFDKEAIRQATLAEYAKGYDKQGERWCTSMNTILSSMGD
jgi:hypothetical protein